MALPEKNFFVPVEEWRLSDGKYFYDDECLDDTVLTPP